MSADDKVSAPGRRPPPRKSRFQKGQSGNPEGRPRGAVSASKLTTKFALRKLKINLNGRPEFKTRLEIVILKLISLAADGKAAAIEEMLRLKQKAAQSEIVGGLLVVPETMQLDEYLARTEEENKDVVAPDTSITLEVEDPVRSTGRPVTALELAWQAHRRKYRS